MKYAGGHFFSTSDVKIESKRYVNQNHEIEASNCLTTSAATYGSNIVQEGIRAVNVTHH